MFGLGGLNRESVLVATQGYVVSLQNNLQHEMLYRHFKIFSQFKSNTFVWPETQDLVMLKLDCKSRFMPRMIDSTIWTHWPHRRNYLLPHEVNVTPQSPFSWPDHLTSLITVNFKAQNFVIKSNNRSIKYKNINLPIFV